MGLQQKRVVMDSVYIAVANYMKEMGGRMWAESEGEGKGTTFILRFPYPDAG